MAHQLEQMAYVGQTPWHGLGNQLTHNQPIEVWAKQAGMDWRIESSNVSYMAQNQRGQKIIMPYEEQRVLYRSDTHAPLSVVSQRFQEVQPMEILEFYRDLTEQSGFELETAGVLKGGKKFWALAKTGQSAALKGKDVSNGYILLATACDGTLATTAQFTSIRVVCNNTLAIALKGQQSSAGVVKVPHSTRFDAEKVKQQLGISVRTWDEHMYEMKQLSQRKVTQQEAAAYFDAVFNNTSLSMAEQDESIIQFYRNVAMPNQTHSTRSDNKTEPNGRAISKVMTMFNGHGRGAELNSAKDTAYGLLCSITEFCDHERRAMSRDQSWPAMPQVFSELAKNAAKMAGFDDFTPDACLINRYIPGARLSLHQDKNERDFDAPIVSVSLGMPAIFLFGGNSRNDSTIKLPLYHGDVVVWGGADRLRYHGVMPLKGEPHELLGSQRINFTFRKAR